MAFLEVSRKETLRPDAAECPRRILYVITDPVSTRLLRGQLRWMVNAGFDVHLACGPGPELHLFGQAEGIPVHELPLVREPKPIQDLRAVIATVALVRRLRPMLINASTPKAGLIGTVAAWLCRVPVRVYVIRGLRFEGMEGLRRSLLRNLDRVAIRLATQVLFNSRSLERRAVDERLIGAGNSIVLGAGSGNGVDLTRFGSLPSRGEARRAAGLDEQAQVIGFVGRFTRDKGVVDLLTAFRDLAATRPALRVLMVGTFEQGDPVPVEVRDAIVGDKRIVLTGWVHDPALVYPAMDLLAFPSYREGLPNGPLEAQASGIPVVGYAATGTVDAVRPGETGELVPVGNISALVEAIGNLLDNPRRARLLGTKGRQWVAEAFRPERVWTDLGARYAAWLD